MSQEALPLTHSNWLMTLLGYSILFENTFFLDNSHVFQDFKKKVLLGNVVKLTMFSFA